MSYAKTYATRAAYISAKASGGEIYSLLSSSNSIAIVSYITATGESAVDSVNTIVPRGSGQIGDLLIYQSATGLFCWAKGNSGGTTAIGSNTIEQTKLVNLGYVIVGWCIHKQGKDCLIASVNDLGTATWGDSTSVSGVNTFSTIARNDGYKTWIVSGSMEAAEKYYGSSTNQYVWPLLRTTWDAAAADASLTYTCTEGSVTITKADYDNDFNKWYRIKILLQFPAKGTCMQDKEGKANTKALITAQGTGSTYAGQKCYAYGVSATGFTAGNWYLPSISELWYILKNKYLLKKRGMAITESWYWSSTQYSATNAWRVSMAYGFVFYSDKSYTYYVRAVSAFQI